VGYRGDGAGAGGFGGGGRGGGGGFGQGGDRKRDRATRRGDRRPIRTGTRRALLEQPVLARGNAGQLLPGVQCNSEFRSVERGEEVGGEVNSHCPVKPADAG